MYYALDKMPSEFQPKKMNDSSKSFNGLHVTSPLVFFLKKVI